ncbi:hypothetical protein [Secundilactobacillus paracollinoides]|uniref:hypothetical protein n=1 Tax=Secundilactobacillus paracollinoides TaxID=240427 RepID=UPI001CDA66A9|nr:hypothetical protein [Secundilactobacillus paracollinoides]
MKLRWLAVAAMINNLGMSFVWPLTSVYLHNQLHQSLTVIGVVLLVNSLTGVAGSTLSGVLYDGHNPFKLLRGAAIILLGVMVGLTLWHGWPIFPVWLAIEAFWLGGFKRRSTPLVQAFIVRRPNACLTPSTSFKI